jgi:phosphoribosylamine--glycine ligase
VKVVEFNCRFGDPEAQPVLARLRSDLVDVCRRALGGGLGDVSLEWDSRHTVGVVQACGGYPLDYQRGDVIGGLDDDLPDTKVFHAGTRATADGVVTSGGRVLCVVGWGDGIAEAHRRAYERAGRIDWRGLQYRRDIGHRALARQS